MPRRRAYPKRRFVTLGATRDVCATTLSHASALLADLVLGLHAAFVVFVVLGGLVALRWRWAAGLHVPAFVWGAWVSLAGWVCPLTPLENRLRRQAGQAGYEGTFLEQYVTPVLYPSGLTREIQIGLGVAVLALNGVVYWIWWRRRRRADRGD